MSVEQIEEDRACSRLLMMSVACQGAEAMDARPMIEASRKENTNVLSQINHAHNMLAVRTGDGS